MTPVVQIRVKNSLNSVELMYILCIRNNADNFRQMWYKYANNIFRENISKENKI